jgi:hypothetical protein
MASTIYFVALPFSRTEDGCPVKAGETPEDLRRSPPVNALPCAMASSKVAKDSTKSPHRRPGYLLGLQKGNSVMVSSGAL